MLKQYCLRCKTTELLIQPGSNDKVTFFKCPECGRSFTLIPGRSLTERWLGPISLLLYPVIFSQQPTEDVDQVIAHLIAVEQWPQEVLDHIINEVTLELEEPTQQVSHIHDSVATEEDTREYLRLMVQHLKLIDPAQYPSSLSKNY